MPFATVITSHYSTSAAGPNVYAVPFATVITLNYSTSAADPVTVHAMTKRLMPISIMRGLSRVTTDFQRAITPRFVDISPGQNLVATDRGRWRNHACHLWLGTV